MNTRSDIAVDKFLHGFNCAQSVFYSFCDDLKLDKNTALKIACGFGGGMGRKQEVCGAISGGILAISAKYGKGENDDRTATDLTYSKTRELLNQFTNKYGTPLCRKLLNDCDLLTPEGQKQFKANDLLNKQCKLYVQSVVEIVESII